MAKQNNQKTTEINQKVLLNTYQKLDSYYKRILTRISDFLVKELFVDKHVKILLAVSGGVDSAVMLDILANLSKEFSFELVICHYNHGLREDAVTDEKFVKSLGRRYGIKVHSTQGNVKEYAKQNKYSIEEAGRKLRYNFLEKTAKQEKVTFVATAHNANDSTETFFLNLFRGSGLTGLGGIPQKRAFFRNINIIRPIIILTRNEIEEYAKKRELRWREDESNNDNSFMRNKIRNHLLPILQEDYSKDIYNLVNRSARMINSADRFIYQRIKPNLNDIVKKTGKGFLIIDLRKLNLFDDFIKKELLIIALANYLNLNNVGYNKLSALVDLYYKSNGSELILNEYFTAIKDREDIVIYRNNIVREFTLKVPLRGEHELPNGILRFNSPRSKSKVVFEDNPFVEYLDKEFLPAKLEVRSLKDGDRFKPLGMHGSMKLSDYITNEKISFLEKRNLYVLTSGPKILWLIGKRLSDEHKIGSDSNRFLRMEFIPNKNN